MDGRGKMIDELVDEGTEGSVDVMHVVKESRGE